MEIDGVPISPDFRNVLNIYEIFQDDSMQQTEQFLLALSQLYPRLPKDLNKAYEGMLWFLRHGEPESLENGPSTEVLNYTQDANLIYASFMLAYKLDLAATPFLHYWEFLALIEGLPEDTILKKVVYWRTADLTKASKEERAHIIKMRKIYALESSRFYDRDEDNLSSEELQKRSIDKINKRMEAIKSKVEKRKNDRG